MRKLKKLERVLIAALLVLSVVLGTGMGILITAFENTADISTLQHFQPEVPSKIYDRNGTLISELFTVKREPVTYDELPRDLINSVLAIEDSQFYDHRGIHLKRVFGALVANIKAGRIEQGASTITMQLARTLFTGREKTYARKIKEMWLALKIEKAYSKNEILTLYFNQIYFGHGAYGIQAAAQFYFNKRVEELTLAECALLAGLPQSPNRLSPLRNPNLARKRQELVLEGMVTNGMVSREEAAESFQDFWVNFRMQLRSPSQSVHKLIENKAPHFTEYVRQRLEQQYGADRIYTGGLKIYTSLDLTQQAYADKYLKQGLARQNEIYRNTMQVVRKTLDTRYLDALDMLTLVMGMDTLDISKYKVRERVQEQVTANFIAPLDMLSFMFGANNINRITESAYMKGKEEGEFEEVEGALIAIEPKTGYITAMVGGSTFSEDNQINRAVQIRRPTGSGFKPFIYTAAVDTKIFTPASVLIDAPVIFFDEEEQWIPDNYSGLYRGKIRLREALRKSVNVITAKVVDRLGIDTVIKYAADIIGITDPAEVKKRFPKVFSIALGVVELSPYEQARAFATYANEGVAVDPIAILYVLNRDGNLIDNFEADLRKKQMEQGERRVLSPQTNFIITDILKGVLQPGGTGYRAASAHEFDRPAAGKTGTTQNWKDAWFTGFTPDLVTSVWVGFDRFTISLGRGQAGGSVAAPIWAQFMRDALKDAEPSWYSKPQGVFAVKVCAQSGLLPTKGCEYVVWEYFLQGTIPTEYCLECGSGEKEDETFNPNIFRRSSERGGTFGRLRSRDNQGAGSDSSGETEDEDPYSSQMDQYDPLIEHPYFSGGGSQGSGGLGGGSQDSGGLGGGDYGDGQTGESQDPEASGASYPETSEEEPVNDSRTPPEETPAEETPADAPPVEGQTTEYNGTETPGDGETVPESPSPDENPEIPDEDPQAPDESPEAGTGGQTSSQTGSSDSGRRSNLPLQQLEGIESSGEPTG